MFNKMAQITLDAYKITWTYNSLGKASLCEMQTLKKGQGAWTSDVSVADSRIEKPALLKKRGYAIVP